MSEIVNVGSHAMDVKEADVIPAYTKVIIHINDEESIVAEGSTDFGSTLEFDNPYGTQAMANNILENIRNKKYKPYTVTGGLIDPSAELGDVVETNGVLGGLYLQDTYFTHQFSSDYSAPQDEQLDHEFTYESPISRRITREASNTKAQFVITNHRIAQEVEERTEEGERLSTAIESNSREISAKVSQTGGNNSSFGWSLVSNGFSLFSGSKNVFTCNSSGIVVDGTIKARSGFIGTDSNGFSISANNINKNKPTLTDYSNSQGVYIGTDGIALGRKEVTNADQTVTYSNMFSVTRAGKLTAQDATITGKITAQSGIIGADANGKNGFTLTANKFYSNGKSSKSSSIDGVYIGTDGIGLGKGKFVVDSEGNLTANNATIKGTIEAVNSKFSGELVGATGTFKGALSAATGSFSGEVVAKTGRIGADSSGNGGFTLEKNKFYNGQKTYGGTDENDVAGVYIGTDGIGLGKGNFYVTKAGKLTAKDVNLSGAITATSGRIGATYNESTNKWEGGFYYTANKMYSDGKSTYNGTTEGVYIGTDGIGLGNKAFYVTKAGKLTATDAVITGAITATSGTFKGSLEGATGTFKGELSAATGSFSGKIIAKEGQIGADSNGNGGFTLTKNKFYTNQTTYNGSATGDTAGVYVGTDGIGLGKGNFYVTSAGKLYAKSGYIGNDDTEANRWQIGSKSIYKGTTGTSSETAGVYLGTDGIRIYKDANNNFTYKPDGVFKIRGGMNSLSDTGNTTGFYFGTDGLVLGGGKFKVTSAGEATLRGKIIAKEGLIGADANGTGGFSIGSKKLYNGTDSISSTTKGVYLGTNGIRVYQSATQNFTYNQNGTLTICGGMTGVDDTTNTTGMFMSNSGIALGGGKFKVTNAGVLTAKSGTIGGWKIGTNSIYNGTDGMSSTTAGSYVGTDGIYVYKNANNNVKIQQSNGTITVKSGMNAISDTTNTSGMFIGSDGIALGGGKFKVTKAGSLTATSGCRVEH